MRAEDVDRLRDEMTVDLMLATSSDTALQRYRLEVAHGYPAYDPDPAGSNLRHLQPRDLITRCEACGRLVVRVGLGGTHEKRFCGDNCQQRARTARLRAERLAQEAAS